MKTPLLVILALFSFSAFGLTIQDLRPGDVVLLSLNCYECRMIESETESLFSHSGVVLFDEAGKLKIAQSLGKVDVATYADFTNNITPGTFVHVYRPRDLKNLTANARAILQKSILDTFNEKYKNAPFDGKFLWNNVNAKGVELLYCSEFIAKFLDNFLSQKTIPLPISYKKNYGYWAKLFKGNVPDGELGNSPAAFSRDARFEFIGKI